MDERLSYVLLTVAAISIFEMSADNMDGEVDDAKQSRAIMTITSSASTAFDGGTLYARSPAGDEITIPTRQHYRITELIEPRST